MASSALINYHKNIILELLLEDSDHSIQEAQKRIHRLEHMYVNKQCYLKFCDDIGINQEHILEFVIHLNESLMNGILHNRYPFKKELSKDIPADNKHKCMTRRKKAIRSTIDEYYLSDQSPDDRVTTCYKVIVLLAELHYLYKHLDQSLGYFYKFIHEVKENKWMNSVIDAAFIFKPYNVGYLINKYPDGVKYHI